ncbi:hypothetical protein KDK95_05610 [Actinospica sp. MGRD01-02]|uniref:Uncharacterized protein n=1 Tax=Actinospica acidithermotolerans TaxID=2828514 RepID=A0A941IJJ7_9ACTN|nr:hypothetical protein [Actinospica acidithermotolerans]MBR7825776.1 hypothetical protein [Actinospica acidithermotolerans]
MHETSLRAPGLPLPDPARRARIRVHLERLGAGPRANFETLCALVDAAEQLPSGFMLIHHMMRELESALREVLRESKAVTDPDGGPGERRRAQILAMLADLPLVAGEQAEARRAEVAAGIAELELAGSGENQRKEIRAIAAGLDLAAEVVAGWAGLAGELHGWAHRRNLEPPRPVDAEVLERVDLLERILDEALDAHATRYGTFVHERLRALLALDAPTKTHAQALPKDFPQDTLTQQVFFTEAGPAWITPLHTAKVFRNPPGLLEDGGVPWWPASAYLVRMAEQAQITEQTDPDEAARRASVQVEIVQAAQGIPDSENPRVGMDLARIARLLEPDRAVRLTDQLVRALAAPHVLGPEHYAAAAAVLADGHGDAAAKVLRALLALDAAEDGYGAPSTRIGDWEYGEVLRTHVPVLVDTMGIDALKLFASLVAESAGDAEIATVWLPAVADAQATEPLFDPRVGLVAAARDVAVRLAEAGTEVEAILAVLPLAPAGLLARIRLHLLGLEPFAAAVPDLVREVISDPGLLHERATETEFLRLVQARAELLAPAERATLQTAIEAGPDTAAWQERRLEQGGSELAAEVLALLETAWRLDRYAAAAAILDDAGREVLGNLVETHGTAPFQRPRIRPVGGFARSAQAAELAGAQSSRELADRLAAAAEAADGQDQDPLEALSAASGLGGELRAAVAAGAAAYSADAAELAEAEAHLVACALGGFGDGLRRGAVLDWDGLQPLVAAAAAARGTARYEAVVLLRTAAEIGALPAHAAGWVWPILAGALSPDPSSEPAPDAAHRGQAVHAVAAFASWARQAEIEEAQAAVDALAGLDPGTEPGPVAEAVGAETATLRVLGHPAAGERLAALAPGTTGFTGYLRSDDLPADRVMLPLFEQALNVELPAADHQKLGIRLLRLYFNDELDLAPGGLAERWWRHPRTDGQTRRGLALTLAAARLEADGERDLFNRYVDWRLDALGPQPGAVLTGPERLELLTLAPTCLRTAPTGEALARLARILAAAGDLPGEPRAWQWLVEAYRTEPLAVLDLLHEWSKHLSSSAGLAAGRRDEQITEIWTAALNSDDPAQIELATKAINRAAAAGYPSYLQLTTTAQQ